MRIIGGKDYYDSAVAFGQDSDIVFIRHKDKRIDSSPIKFPNLDVYLPHLGYSIEATTSHITLLSYYLIVAGKVWPIVCIPSNLEPLYCYSYTSLMQCLSSLYGYKEPTYRYSAIKEKDFFNYKLTSQDLDWLMENKITIMHNEYREDLSFYTSKYIYNRERSQDWKIDSFDLKQFNLHRQVDPYAMHQEIAMWVGNLGKPGNLMIEIDEKTKIHKHGFDKFSFRKGKEK